MGSVLPQIAGLLESTRGVKVQFENTEEHPLRAIRLASARIRDARPRESEALQQVLAIAANAPNYGGLGLDAETPISEADRSELIFLVSAWLEALNSADRSRPALGPSATKPADRRPMNITEKIFALHDVETKGWVKPGQMIRVRVDWIMANRTQQGMVQVYDRLGKPGIFRNDRFWLAGDHSVEPRNLDTPLSRQLIAQSEGARRAFKMTEYQGMNYTIMHTEFFRERAQPGMLVVGSDSHTCSSGANGCLAVGLGAADVTMALVTGETWFRVPEVVEIRFEQLKRNTVAADRVVEYTGPGLDYLSPDARFAIANMTTEFGGTTGIFAPDHHTASFINQRKLARHKNHSYYFKPDPGCQYAASHVIDLARAEPFVARYPNPDDVVPVGAMARQVLDGCFIGACTTAEEDIILGALVLEAGLMKAGKTPVAKGKRKVVPGSRPILDRLRTSGLADVYEWAGFEIGVPGAATAQNRNFKNRMGKGSIGNLASAATVAASSFEMKMTSPNDLVAMISDEQWERVKGKGSLSSGPEVEPQWVEPPEPTAAADPNSVRNATASNTKDEEEAEKGEKEEEGVAPKLQNIKSKIYRLGDFVDTDALAPAQFLMTAGGDAGFGAHCLEFTHPDFRQAVAEHGAQVVVAGRAFGCGSSRMEAVQALRGAGVRCVIARSFAFIYARNQPSLGLLGITLDDPAFYEAVDRHGGEDVQIEIDLVANVVRLGGGGGGANDDNRKKEFAFELSQMEKRLTELGGVAPAFNKFGKQIFDALTSGSRGVQKALKEAHGTGSSLAW
ncbi:aconitase family protein [Apiospora phragmitis]|uniref:Aconitase family protein n=1 Tax=Apiospora phragmitis TaxID=2905665 RepID=A0ABR1T949_9PEZI